MSLEGLQNFTEPLSLLGDVTIKGNFNAKDIYVNGVLTGGGISTDILGTDNTWTGTNTYNNTTSYTGSNPAQNNDLTTKKDVDDLVTSYNSGLYNPITSNNTWSGTTTFSNINPPTVPYASVSSKKLVGFGEMVDYIQAKPSIPSNTGTNTFTGNNQFTLNPQVSNIPSLLIPTQGNQIASKLYVDSKLEVSGKTLTYNITTTGSYNFEYINRANVAKIEFILYGGSYNGSYSGAMFSGTIGNANGSFGSLFLRVGIKNDPTNYTSYSSTSVASNTYLTCSGQVVGVAGGAYLLNGVPQAGQDTASPFGMQGTLTSAGKSGADNLLKYSNILGTLTSNGGAILIAYYK